MRHSAANIVREYGPFPNSPRVNGVTYDGAHVWIAVGDAMKAIDPETGETARSLDVAALAGSAFDGRHLYQIAGEIIQKLDPGTGEVLASVPAPEGGAAGMAWADGFLWIGQHNRRRIHKIDPATGDVLATISSNRFVTGVTWARDQLWHATWEEGRSELRQVDPGTGQVLEIIEMPPDVGVSGLESDGGDRFFCGGGSSGKLRIVRKP